MHQNKYKKIYILKTKSFFIFFYTDYNLYNIPLLHRYGLQSHMRSPGKVLSKKVDRTMQPRKDHKVLMEWVPLLEILSRTPFPSILFPVGQREDAVWLWQRPSEIGEPDAWRHWGYTVTLSTQKVKGDPFNYSNTHTTLVSKELSFRPTS